MITRMMIRVAAIGAVASLALTGCGRLPGQDTAASQAPVITQARAVEVMTNYSAVNNMANRKRDPKLLATVEDGDLLKASQGGYAMLRRLKDKTPYKPFKYSKPIAFAPRAGAYPWAFLAYAKSSAASKANVLTVFRKNDALTPWKLVVSGSSEGTLPVIALDKSGMATMVAPTASGYAVKPIDVAPALANAMLGTTSGGGNFATSPILRRFNNAYTKERASAKGRGTATRAFTPTKDIYSVKTQDGGVLVMGGMGWRQEQSYLDGWEYVPKKGDEVYPLHPDPITYFYSVYKAMWAVQIPVKGALKLVSWNSSWANYNAS